MAIEFEWDQAKSERTRRERGFDKAALIFDGPVQTVVDDRRDYREERLIAIGAAEGDALGGGLHRPG